MKYPIFEAWSGENVVARWYSIVNGRFYYWSVYHKEWRRSHNAPGQNERRLQKAIDEKRVHFVKLKGFSL